MTKENLPLVSMMEILQEAPLCSTHQRIAEVSRRLESDLIQPLYDAQAKRIEVQNGMILGQAKTISELEAQLASLPTKEEAQIIIAECLCGTCAGCVSLKAKMESILDSKGE